jgi:mannose/fructose/N-acetylgalactosamine-specific phosphotransferase system component IIB
VLEEKVQKNDLQYLLSNKVSIEEMQKLLASKSNAHEINVQIQQLDAKVEDAYREMNQKMATFALQKDLSYLSTLVDHKANIEEVNESLQQKANKTSVANAL